jgi:hypothetical protein
MISPLGAFLMLFEQGWFPRMVGFDLVSPECTSFYCSEKGLNTLQGGKAGLKGFFFYSLFSLLWCVFCLEAKINLS